MTSKELFDKNAINCSKLTTRAYSTSFSLGILCLHKDLRDPIYSVYGFVRFADEIVDTFHQYDKKSLLEEFKKETYKAIRNRISLNPILQSFQLTVNQYNIDSALIDQFLHSMEMDLREKEYDQPSFEEYILGSAEVVGLMCLKVFCNGDQATYCRLKPMAMRLGAAFQKINFLRDLNADYVGMGRSYFPEVDLSAFDNGSKEKIEENIAADFREGYKGIEQLPKKSKLGVYVAYLYYLALFKKIKGTPPGSILKKRIRVRNPHKFSILLLSYLKHQLNLI
ncbi:MAG TPA: phytoene/squalene synthase family protein [Cyclobacteriaceae bacterium]|nr:phytoene/squalene synthase family protein [Cyclobacteriaceae bacterium]